MTRTSWTTGCLCAAVVVTTTLGCALPPAPPVAREAPRPEPPATPAIVPVSHQQAEHRMEALPWPVESGPAGFGASVVPPDESLEDLEAWAVTNNPALRRMGQEAAAARAKAGYVAKLPDPTIGTMIFGAPMNFVPDRQLAELQLMQMIPWLGRLHAEARQAQLEALVAENLYVAERLRVVADLRTAWFRLYVLRKQIETAEADQAQLQSLINTARARLATGAAQPGDVLMATLELSSLQEQRLGFHQLLVATTAELNRLLGRDPGTPVTPPTAIDAELPVWNHELLTAVAREAQPELTAARLRTAATRWGIEVARLERRPDLTFGAGWMVMAADPADTMPGAGDDAWTLGVTASVPLWHRKYDAMLAEAAHQHSAAHASEDEIRLRIEATLRDLWEQARAGQQVIELYEQTILPQARQIYEADQKSLVNNSVAFDRVIRDYRALLNLELSYHRARGQLATTLARIRQTVGVDLLAAPRATEP